MSDIKMKKLSKTEFMQMYNKDIERKKEDLKEKKRDIDNYVFGAVRAKRKGTRGRYRMSDIN